MSSSTPALVTLTNRTTKAQPSQTQKPPAKSAWAKLMDSPPGSKKDSLKKAACKLPLTYSPSPALIRSDLKSTPPRPEAPTVVGATPSEGKVSPAGEGKAYLQPNNITKVTAESLVASTRASTRAALLKASNQAV